jgi:group I intron endonuclease
MVGIYKIISPNGKTYVGKSINIEERFKSYQYEGRRKNQLKLNNSIKKYGLENHVFELLEECSEFDLNKREIYWIDKLDTVKNGLNLMYGGQGGKQSQEVKDKKSKTMTGRKASEETKQKMSQAKKNHPMYTDQWRQQISKANIGGTSSKPVLQFTLDGIFLKEWSSKAEASKALNINPFSISNNTIGRNKSAGGYIWKNK